MTQKNIKNKGLGRGLSALMSDISPIEPATREASQRLDQMIPIEKIEANPNQPRRTFDETDLNDLAQSIRERGVIQPVIVRVHPDKADTFQIVAGERRWRAAQLAQLHDMPALVRDYTETEVLEVAIIENIQRADLNAVDEANGYQNLLQQFGHTQEQLAQVLGKSRSHIANLLRLLTLPKDVQDLIESGKLSAGHARALVGNPLASDLARQIIAKGLSVREVERLVKTPPVPKSTIQQSKPQKDADTVQIERELAAQLGMKVLIQHDSTGEGGRLQLNYKSLEQLDDLLRILSGQ